MRAIQERRPADLEECRSCPYRQLCQGGCAVQAFERFGTVFHRTPECSFLRRLYPYLMRWLSFDRSALAWLVHCQYFGRTGANLAVQQVLGDEAPD